MTANAFAISRELVAKGLDRKHADAIAEVVVTRVDESSATKAELAKVEAKVDAERETKSDRLDKMDTRMDRMEGKIDKIISDVSDLKVKGKILMWLLGVFLGLGSAILFVAVRILLSLPG